MKIYIHSVFLEPTWLIPAARRAEELGYHGFTVSDHLLYPKDLMSRYPYGEEPFPSTSPWPDIWVTVAALAGATTRLRFLSCIYLALARPPVAAAKAVATAAILSGYRVDFGMAVGWMREEFEHMGQDFATRGRRHDEMVQLLREIWSGEWVEHHGPFYDYPPFRVLPAPDRPIPILGGGDSEVAMRRSAVLDGWLGSRWYATEDALELVERMGDYRREAGTEATDFQVFLSLDHAPTLEECRRFEQLGVTGLWTHPWTPIGEPTKAPAPTLEQVMRGMEDYADRVVSRL